MTVRGAVGPSVIAASLILAAGRPAPAAPTHARFASAHTRLEPCRRIGASTSPDWMAYRCRGWGRVPAWLAYTDSTKAHLGFGARENVSGVFGIDGVRATPVEWRGVRRGGGLRPFAVIARLRSPLDQPRGGRFVVWRLRPDGTSCIVGDARSRAQARRIADASRTRFTCKEQPDLP